MLNKDEIDAATKITSEVIKPVYDDGISPGMKEVGTAVQTVTGLVNVFLLPLAVLVHGVKEIENKLKDGISKRLASIPSDQIVQPSLNIVGPLLEKYKYNHDSEEIGDLFLNLLANSMDAKRISEAHPAFIELISQLSPDEARLFKNIISSVNCPKIDICVESIKDKSYNLIKKNILLDSFFSNLEHVQFVTTYLDNLQRLGLIFYTSGSLQEQYKNEDLYNPLLSSVFVKSLEKSLDPGVQKVKILKGHVSITDFGRTFNSAVTR